MSNQLPYPWRPKGSHARSVRHHMHRALSDSAPDASNLMCRTVRAPWRGGYAEIEIRCGGMQPYLGRHSILFVSSTGVRFGPSSAFFIRRRQPAGLRLMDVASLAGTSTTV